MRNAHSFGSWKQAGFTRLQNIMIFIVAAILIAVSCYEFMAYRQGAYLLKVNRSAAKAFEAASTYMEERVKKEALPEFNREARHYGGVVSRDILDAILESVYEGDDFSTFIEDFHQTYQNIPFYYVVLDSADKTDNNREGNPVLTMFENQLLDEKITTNTFLIIYSGDNGKVLSVLYSEEADTLTFEGELDDKTNAILRDEKSLKQKWQGYCGVDLKEW
jgi:hypothetical protein